MNSAGGSWSEQQVSGHVCRVFQPQQLGADAAAVIYLHDLPPDRLLEDPAFHEIWSRAGLRVLCPLAGPCWWTDRICAAFDPERSGERYLLEDVCGWIAQQWRVEPPRVAVCGVGMGGQGALRLAYRFPRRFAVAAAVCPEIDFHREHEAGDPVLAGMYRDPEAARQDTALLHIQPLNWPRHQWFCCPPEDTVGWDSADRLRMKLASLGVPFACDLETPGGDPREYTLAMLARAVDFLVQRLERERLRLA